MLIDVKIDELKPNTILFYDGKKIVSITEEQLLGDINKKLKSVIDFQDSLLKRQENHEVKIEEKQNRFIRAFKGDKI